MIGNGPVTGLCRSDTPLLARDRGTVRLRAQVLIYPMLDLFRDEDVAFAHRLWQAPVPTDLMACANVVHGFDLLPSCLARRVRHDVPRQL